MILRPLSSFFEENSDFTITFKDERAMATINKFSTYGNYGSFSAGIDSGSIRFTKCVGNTWSSVSIEVSDDLLAFIVENFRAMSYNTGGFWVSYPVFPHTTLQSYVRFGVGGSNPTKRFPSNFSYVFWFPKGKEVVLRMFNACIDMRIFPIASGAELFLALDSAIS